MKRFSLSLYLIFIVTISIAQKSNRTAQGELFTKQVVTSKGGTDSSQPDNDNFKNGANELKKGNYKSALKTFNNYLSDNPDDFSAYYNRGLTYYYLEDIEHACMDWKYSAYFDVFYARKNYKSVCDTAFNEVNFLNGGLSLQSALYGESSEDIELDTVPSFPGGQSALNNFLRDNLNINHSLYKEFLKSRIIVRFTVMEDGTVSDPKVVDDENPDLSKEAIRISLSMPKWNPARKNGNLVVSQYHYPIINGKDSIRLSNQLFREGVFLFDQSDFNGALNKFSKCIAINEEDDDARYNRGVCNMKLGDSASACKDWNRPSMRWQISVVKLLNKYCHADLGLDKLPTIRESGQLVYTIVEEMPGYQGGEGAMLEYLAQNIVYPVVAKRNRITGRVYVSFIVDKDGYVREAKVLRGIGGGCDEEALRVVQLMPQWNPGFQNGRPVNVQYNLPIHFTL